MRRVEAATTLLALAALSWLAFVAPVAVLAWLFLVIAFDGRFGMGKAQTGYLTFFSITLVLNALFVAWSSPGTGAVLQLGPVAFGLEGAARGIWGGLRLVAIVGVNMAWLQDTNVAAVLDGLRMPRRITVFLAALLIAVQDIGRDFQRLLDGRRMTGDWPTGRSRQVVAVAGLITPLLVASVARARVRRDALRLAGIPTSKRFVPLVAITALALAGRFALVAVPNVSLVHVVVFLGGVVFGPLVGVGAAVLSMGISDLFLSGLLPTAFVNVPAMALIGLLGGSLRRLDMNDGAGRVIAAALGVLATFMFSVVADVGEWLMVPEFRGDWAYLQARVVAGVLFNVLPAIVNGALFAVVTGPVQQAFMTTRPSPEQSRTSPIPATDLP